MSASPAIGPNDLRSRLRPMRGRNPHEEGRAASTLELLFDLTFVVAVATGGTQLAERVLEGHAAAGIGGFCVVGFGIIWAWINYSWFASAYDTDDWLYRMLTLVQMVGVVVFTLGIPDLFAGLEHGRLDNTVIVIGYVIMRLAMLCQWGRAYATDARHRPEIKLYMGTLVIAQVAWLASLPLNESRPPLAVCIAATALLVLLEMSGPLLAERAGGTPWHAHHIVERHGLLTIITIGEIITGTVVTLQHIKDAEGSSIDWSDAVLVAVCGTAMAFGMWWAYFLTPFAETLHVHRERSFAFSYTHFLIWPALAAVGSGLHVMSQSFEKSEEHGVAPIVTALALAVPVGVFMAGLLLTRYLTLRSWGGVHTGVLLSTVAVLAAAVASASAHAPMPFVLALCTLVPWLFVAAFELSRGAEHDAQVLAELGEAEACGQ